MANTPNEINFKFSIATVGADKQLAYVMVVNNGIYKTGKLLTEDQRHLLKISKEARTTLKNILMCRFLRHIGAI